MSEPSTAVPLAQATFLREFFEVTKESKNNSHWLSYCKACVNRRIEEILAGDRTAVENNERQSMRSLKEAELAAKASIPGMPIGSRPDSLLTHVRKCTLVGGPEFRQNLVKKRQAEKVANAERIAKCARKALDDRSNTYSSGPARFSGPIPGYGPSPSPPRASSTVYPFAPSLPQGLPTYPGTPRFPAEPFLFGASTSQFTQPTFEPPPQAMPSRPPTPLQRNDGSFWAPSDIQREFAADLTRLFAACNIAWNVVEHPETKAFYAKWIPHVDLPSRQSMAGPLLRAQVAQSISNVQRKVQGGLAMAQWDGWKNKARHPVITCLMTVRGEAYLVRSHDTFGMPKTGEFLWTLSQRDIDYMRETYGVDLVGICTDNGPDGKGMRRLARIQLPWLIIVLCWAHQNQLIIGDLIRQYPALKALLTRALDLIKWFLHHGVALALLHKEQLIDEEVQHAVTLLLPIVTRWGAHYISVSRLLRLKDAMRSVCVRKASELLAIRSRADTNESESSRTMTAEDVINTVADNQFWSDLKRAKEHIEPLAISCHILQADGVRMDQVLLTLGNLFRIYAAADVDEDARRCVHASLEKRWKAADQEPFILAVLFNPYIRRTCFRDTALPPNVLAEICSRTFARVMRRDASARFWSACHRYMQSEGAFSSFRMALERHRAAMDAQNTVPDLVEIWEALRSNDARTADEIADNELVLLAIRILSVVANSGACERCFSRFGITHTALRNRLAAQSTHDINLVRMDVDAVHAATGHLPSRLKRQLGRTSSSAGDNRSVPAHDAALQDAVAQLLADEDAEGDPTSLESLEARMSAGAGTSDASTTAVEDEFPASFTGSFTKVTLADLFRYPEDDAASTSPLAFYWNGGIRNLEEEEEVMDAAAGPVASA